MIPGNVRSQQTKAQPLTNQKENKKKKQKNISNKGTREDQNSTLPFSKSVQQTPKKREPEKGPEKKEP